MDTYHGFHTLCWFSRDGPILEMKVSSKICHVYKAPLSGLIVQKSN
jgi:hypothetical protein